MYDVILTSQLAGHDKLNAIRVVRAILGLGLKDAKDLVESAPGIVAGYVDRTEANRWATEFHFLGMHDAIQLFDTISRERLSLPDQQNQPQKVTFGELRVNDVFHDKGVEFIKINYIPRFLVNAVRCEDRHLCLFHNEWEVIL